MPNIRVLFSADERMPGAEPRVTAAADTRRIEARSGKP